ncbi:MAG: DUF4389 domain-containing protein [Actinomycetota bacterium]
MSPSGAWRPDPTGRFEYRWWDGERFTEYAATDGEQVVDFVDDAGALALPTTVDVAFGPSGPQRRATVAFRLVLAIPHLVWIAIVTIGACFVLLAAWFVALFTGVVPDGMARFLHQVLQYHVRLLAYLYLLRDDYPPFALDDECYPVSVATRPSPLNRLAVLGRLVLGIPVIVLVNWIGSGVVVVLVVLWVVVLVTGRMPGTPALALGALVRYQARTFGYLMLLATAYPTGLLGDQAREDLPGAGAPGLPDQPAAATRLVLPTGAKVIVVLSIVLGIAQSFVPAPQPQLERSARSGPVVTQESSAARSCSSSCSSTAPDLS